MSFYWPHAFWLLVIPAGLLALNLRRRRATSANARPKIPHAEARQSYLVLGPGTARPGAARARLLFSLGLVAAIVAVARPQWGQLEEPVFDQAREIIIALDLSRSMLAEDVKPSRLERTRLLITSLLERLKGERVGLVVFSGTA
jgi:Ca-activated chloride channel family protein